MNVVFVHSGGPDMASFRYRASMPALELRKQGFEVSLNDGMADVVVFSKPDAAGLDVARRAKKDGTKIVADFCDDHFSHETLGPVYREFIGIADQVICPTAGMQEKSGGDVIADPYEIERCQPHANGDECIWFGHQRNLDEIIGSGLKLRIVTGPNERVKGYVPWSVENLKANLAVSNIAVLPTLKWGEYKSANRVINAAMAGCFVVAGDKPSYREFRKFLWIGPTKGGMQWAKAFQNELNDRVTEAQDYIESKYSPKVIGQQWADMLNSL